MKSLLKTTLSTVSIAFLIASCNPTYVYPQKTAKPILQFAQHNSCSPKKTCGQMRSCTEAYFRLTKCGDKRRDGDNDGIPCENICGKTHQRMKQLLDAGL